jgi:hypothetical protein
MRSADIRAGLIRVTALSKRALSVPEISSPFERSGMNRWRPFAIGAVILALLVPGAWYAGRESAGRDAQQIGSEVDQLAHQVASTQLALQQQKGKAAAVTRETQLRQQLLKAQAEANNYKQIIERERQSATDNSRLVDALSNPRAYLLPLKGSEAAADSTAYALLVENSRLLVVASNLPELENGKQFQVWVVRKEDPKFVSAGVFAPDSTRRAFMSYDEPSILSGIAQVEVTEEPDGGSSAPTGAKLLESTSGAIEPARPDGEEAERVNEEGLPTGASLRYRHRGTSR